MRVIPDQRDIHPELSRGIRELVEVLDNPPPPGRGPSPARLIGNRRSNAIAVPGITQ